MRRWEDNIRTDLRKICLESVDWTHLAQGRDQWRARVNMVMNHCVLHNSGNSLTSCVTVRFSRTFFHVVSSLFDSVPLFLTCVNIASSIILFRFIIGMDYSKCLVAFHHFIITAHPSRIRLPTADPHPPQKRVTRTLCHYFPTDACDV
jgi:hypothetical protein